MKDFLYSILFSDSVILLSNFLLCIQYSTSIFTVIHSYSLLHFVDRILRQAFQECLLLFVCVICYYCSEKYSLMSAMFVGSCVRGSQV